MTQDELDNVKMFIVENSLMNQAILKNMLVYQYGKEKGLERAEKIIKEVRKQVNYLCEKKEEK